MELDFVRLLRDQRELYRLPRGMDRFRQYLRMMVDSKTGDLALPLVAMNPMAGDHVPALLDRLSDLEADSVGEQAVASAREQVKNEPGRFHVGLVVADDVRGAWTHRYTSEFSHRFEETALYKRGWIVGILWTSESPTRSTIREETLTSIYRAAYIQRHGVAKRLGDMLTQEGLVMAMAGCLGPVLEPDDLAYTREVLASFWDASDRATIMAGLFGDEAATALGYRAQGLSHRAGLALALHQARSRERPPGEMH